MLEALEETADNDIQVLTESKKEENQNSIVFDQRMKVVALHLLTSFLERIEKQKKLSSNCAFLLDFP